MKLHQVLSLAFSFQGSQRQRPLSQQPRKLLSTICMTSSSTYDSSTAKVRLIWHRRDLRLNDNELYSNLHCDDSNGSHKNMASVSLFVFDPQYFEPKPSLVNKAGKSDGYQTCWCGPYAAQALIEAVSCLRNRIRSLGGELLIRTGDPSIIIPEIAQEIGATEIMYSEEPGSYENEVAQKLKQRYAYQYGQGEDAVNLISTSGYTLYHPDDLPLDPNEWDRLAHPKKKHGKKKKLKPNHNASSTKHQRSHHPNSGHLDLVDVSTDRFKGMCRIMGDFRKAAKGATAVRGLIDAPDHLLTPDGFDAATLREKEGIIPTLEDLIQPLQKVASHDSILGLNQATIDFVVQSAIAKRNNNRMEGREGLGESSAVQRLNYFIENHAIAADRSRADVSNNNSSRFSVHFALGTLSPRSVYWKAHDSGEGCEWLMSHLEMRDFFLYTTYAAGDRIFSQEGLPVSKKQAKVDWVSPDKKFEHWERWATGKTQLPMVDAAMLELMSTGYCSNRVRQNIASVLTKDLKIDWRVGAEWFQFLLEDHCVGANFGNWLYFSGVGPDPKQRHFRTVSQLKRYDSKGTYVKKWLPILDLKDKESTFRPWDFDVQGFESPLVDPITQYTWQDLQDLKENGKLFASDCVHVEK